jgi:alpha-tubulin suppressor-like RCC1 family protein
MSRAAGAWATAAMAAAGLVGSGCSFHPDYPNGAIPCGAQGECPEGFRCEFDRMCYQVGGDKCPAGTVPLAGGGCSDLIQALSVAPDHSCAVHRDGLLWCWGANDAGQLGTGKDAPDSNAPVQVGSDAWATVSVAERYTCGIRLDGTLWCWGDNNCGVIGTTMPSQQSCDGFAPVYAPLATGGARAFLAVATGPTHVCAIDAEHALWCWGENFSGQAGVGNTMPVETATRVGMDTAADKDWQAVVAGASHSCGLRAGGALWCWGRNSSGQLGDDAAEPMATTPRRIGDVALASLAAGSDHTCGVTASGGLLCWGADDVGQLGDGASGDTATRTAPIAVGAGTQWSQVAAAGGHTCARDVAGHLLCFGENQAGELGDGSFVQRASPTPVGIANDWADVVAGPQITCGKKSDGHVSCWGSNAAGAFGIGKGGPAYAPRDVATGAMWKTIGVGNAHACGIRLDGTLWCWGDDTRGQLGIGPDAVALGAIHDAPTQVMVGTLWDQLGVGADHTCAVTSSGALYCWGANNLGQIGIGGTAPLPDEPSPRRVGASDTYTQVAAAESTTCAIRTGGNLVCWGTNGLGQVGSGTLGGTYTSPFNLGGNWNRVVAGPNHTCALTSGNLYCWGYDAYGQVGKNPPASGPAAYAAPQQVGSATGWIDLALGRYHTCALQSFGTGPLFCFGYNPDGELGIGATSTGVTLPMQVGTGYRAVAAAESNSCAIATSGVLRCWGAAGSILGNGLRPVPAGMNALTPATVGAFTDWTAVTIGGLLACALHADGSYACWGSDATGGFGDDATLYETPTPID